MENPNLKNLMLHFNCKFSVFRNSFVTCNRMATENELKCAVNVSFKTYMNMCTYSRGRLIYLVFILAKYVYTPSFPQTRQIGDL